MAVTLAALRAGLAANLTAAFPTTQVNQYVLADPHAPTFEIDTLSGTIAYDAAMGRGIDEYRLTVRGIVGLTSDQEAQKTLDVWLDKTGANSVKAALESDRTLGGAANDLRVETVDVKALANPSVPNAQYLAAEWAVYLIA